MLDLPLYSSTANIKSGRFFGYWLSPQLSFLLCLSVSPLGCQKLFGGRKPSHQGVWLRNDKVTQGFSVSRLWRMTLNLGVFWPLPHLFPGSSLMISIPAPPAPNSQWSGHPQKCSLSVAIAASRMCGHLVSVILSPPLCNLELWTSSFFSNANNSPLNGERTHWGPV